jgi:hypothetical protein
LPNLREAVATKEGPRNLGRLWVPAMNINKVDPFKRNQHREQLAAEKYKWGTDKIRNRCLFTQDV